MARTFFESVWKKQPGVHFLALKGRDGSWEEFPQNGSKSSGLDPDEGDVYFCPNGFRKPRRVERLALPTVWLHADLDEVKPDGLDLMPTFAWETSPGRYQCLWRLTKSISIDAHRKLNQRLTYLTGADKGGWSITKVLRPPGTLNHKRKTPFEVELLWDDGPLYEPKTVLEVVRHVDLAPGTLSVKDFTLPDKTADAVIRGRKLSERAKQLIRTKRAIVGERSDRLWELECLLLDAGLTPEETLVVVRDTVWNKFAGQRREVAQLWKEVLKAKTHVEAGSFNVTKNLELMSYEKFMKSDIPVEIWTVEGVWSHDAHGLIAGESKTYKSLVSTDLAVSVASGTPFLGTFAVPEVGPVIIIQEENTPAMMKDRLEKIANSRLMLGSAALNGKNLEIESPRDLPIFLMNNSRFNLTDEDHLEKLEGWIKAIKPKLVILDPLYLMIPGVDENSAQSMVPVLRDLLTLKQRYDVGMLIVHHYNKPRDGEDRHPGYRITGTGAFYRWFESALYLEKGPEPMTVVMTPEHRGSPPQGSIYVEFDMGEMGELDYHPHVEIRRETGVGQLRRHAKEKVTAEPGIKLMDLAAHLDISKQRCERLLRVMGMTIRKAKASGKAGRPPMLVYPAKEDDE